MKYLIALTALFFLLYSCKKEKPKAEPYAGSAIVGKWYLTTDSLLSYKNNKLDRIVSIDTYNRSEGFYDQFNSDGSAVINMGYGPEAGVFTLSGSNINITASPISINANGTSGNVAGLFISGQLKILSPDNILIRLDSYGYSNGDTTRSTRLSYFTK